MRTVSLVSRTAVLGVAVCTLGPETVLGFQMMIDAATIRARLRLRKLGLTGTRA
ncbi:hypothetical protein KBC55_01905 [Patescibacteria group bacterium]|nr:hypothetical protein [Patescibacteria group bacterium]